MKKETPKQAKIKLDQLTVNSFITAKSIEGGKWDPSFRDSWCGGC
ncbi:MAG: hypothetical protein QNK37_28605 [Acidobacteriota bacterium]|nr:hypothetical protein [Acidobacteriota bacterium]